MRLPKFSGGLGCLAALLVTQQAVGTTTVTNTRSEIALMASLWESDSLQISPLADAQYPQYGSSLWQYIFPHTSISSDGDIHIDMATDSSGTGKAGNNTGESPIISEVVNATTAQLSHLQSISGHQVKMTGIFRWYTEHASERHFELHPVTGAFAWNGSSFVLDTDYHPNITSVADGTTHANSTLISVLNGSETMSAAVQPDNVNVVLTYPSPSVNYVQYDGIALSTLLNDGISYYFLFRPSLVPSATVRCRVVTNTPAANAAAGLTVNLPVTVNALTRTDMLTVSNQVAALSANQSATFARPVELITLGISGVNAGPYLAITPSTGFFSSGNPGGPFAPVGQTYLLTNVGSDTLNWTATCPSNWVTLSATSGTLGAGAGTNVTVSINANANTLAAGNYSAPVAFTNNNNDAGDDTRTVNLSIGTPNAAFGFFDNFSTFAPGNLVGQGKWTQLGASSSLPLQISGGQVIIPFAQSADNQDAYKNFDATNITVFYGFTLTVSNAPISSAPSYFAALWTSNNATGFANYRLSARDNGSGTCVLGARVTGQSTDPYTFGTTSLTYATQHRVIVEADSGGTVMEIYIDPTSSNLADQTAYLTHTIGSGASPPTQVGSLNISQFASGTVPNAGISIGRVVVSDNFATVYNDLTDQPPVASFSGLPGYGVEPLDVTFTDASTGNITNRFWDFGDGDTTNITATNIVHNYDVGVYSVTLVVSGPGGSSTNIQPNYIQVVTEFQDWQIENFGSTNSPDAAADADPDGDGMNNYSEFLVGTDPNDNGSDFRITSIAQQGDDIRIAWTMGPRRTNVLQRAASLLGGFSDLVSIVTQGFETNYLDAGAATNLNTSYYRVRLGP